MTAREFVVVLGIVILQACLGGTYAWSLFDAKLVSLGLIDPRFGSLPFNVFYFMFPLTLLWARKVISVIGTQYTAMLGLSLYALGWASSALTDGSLVALTLGVGVFGGVGIGLSYLVPIIVGISWFPRHVGVITGMAVGGFAAGAAFVSAIAEYALEVKGLVPTHVLSLIGGLFFIVGIVPAFLMKSKQVEAYSSVSVIQEMSYRNLVANPYFSHLFIAMAIGLTAGFFINSKLIALADLFAPSMVSLLVVFAISNALGRIFWGAICDRASTIAVIRINLIFQAVGLAIFFSFSQWIYAALLLAAFSGFNYGGVLVLYAVACKEHWGERHFTKAYSLLFLANIIGALASGALSVAYQVWGIVFVITFIVSGLLIACYLLRPPRECVVSTQH